MAGRARTRGTRKIAKTMGEFKRGSLKSGSGDKVTNRKQAVAIALNQQRKADRERSRRA